MCDPSQAPDGTFGRRMAYLLSRYPAISHTFFLNEICELRKLGFVIDVASINTPNWPSDSLPEREAEEQAATLYIKSMSRTRIARLLVALMFTRPEVVLRGIAAALRLAPGNLHATAYAFFYLIEALIVGSWLHQRGHTHLHVHFGGPVATVGMLTSLAWQIPYSLMIHGPDEFYDVDQLYLKNKVANAQFVFCISEYCRSQIMKVSDPKDWSKLHVLRLGVDARLFVPSSSRQENRIREIVCVGRLVPAKGQLVLVRAVASLLSQGYPVRLRLIGDGEDRGRLETLIQQEGLSDSIVLEGALDHQTTRRVLGNADVFALASFAEGLPVALMEAMAMEIPCVSTFIAGIPELIRDGLDGLLVPPSSHEALAEAIKRLVVDIDLRRSLGTSGRQRVLEFYDLHRNMRVLADAFRRQIGIAAAPTLNLSKTEILAAKLR
jgi:glycosyltransferase involved in cell wall biosynthesis